MNIRYNKIGTDYNRTRKADPLLTEKLLFHLNPNKKGTYLDIGCGTGNYTNELQKSGIKCIGIDPSEKMLGKAKLINSEIEWKVGSAEQTRLPTNSVDGIIASLTIHHWYDLQKGFSELHRILKPNGKIVIFTSIPKQMKGYWLNHYFPKMLLDSMIQMPTLSQVETAMTNNGFTINSNDIYDIKPDLEDKFLYCGKHNPELYFDPKIRHGISSFSSLANKTEIEQGLLELRKDIDNGRIKSIIKSYENDFGDYLFVIGKKPVVNSMTD